MTPSEFSALAAAGYNRIPVYRDVIADLDTPLSTYLKLADGPYSYLLESAQGGEKWGRFSILGLPCSTVLKVNDKTVTIEDNGRQTEQHQVDDPLSFIEQFQARYKVAEVPGLPRFVGGLVGYFGYDTMRYVEPRMAHSTPPDTINTPDILLMVSNDVIVFDSLKGILTLVTHADPAEKNALEKAQTRLDLLSMRLREAVPAQSYSDRPAFDLNEVDFVSSFGEQEFHQSVDKIKDYIVQGDVMQVVISQRKSCDINCQPIEIYRALRNLNPSPYMYFMNFGDFHIVSSSPEILAHLDNGEVTVRPLAGTRRRGYNNAEDIALEKELLADPKEIAEHLMLIDLARNDTGRIAQTGTVEVTDQFIVERYSHVMHIASNVIGQIKPGVTAMDVLRATLPVGTLSGAPKIRAMEIIDELEPEKRGVFGGAVGYLAWNGNMDTAIAIRTAVIKDNKLYVQAGAGVVADSIPALEWKETNNKARAIVQAACIAEKGLDYLGLEQQKLNSHHK